MRGFSAEAVARRRVSASAKESQYRGFSTSLRFGRNDRVWVGGRKPGSESPDPGHPECAGVE